MSHNRPIQHHDHESQIGRWHLVRAAPSPLLRGILVSYTGYRELEPQTLRRREVPTHFVPLILNFGTRFNISQASNSWRQETHDSFVAGLDETFALVESHGTAHCLQADFTALGAFQILGLPLSHLRGRSLSAHELLGRGCQELVEQLDETPSWEQRFDLMDEFLLKRLANGRAPSTVTTGAWKEIMRTAGRCRIDELARSMQRSREHLARTFRQEVGLSPKEYARVVRFRHAMSWIEKRHGDGWCDIALECGYADQSHLINEFHALGGLTPIELAGRLIVDGGVIDNS